ncbi:acyl-protein synthetase [Christensenellaceae bacterium OttesenSCG-928-M15]|nr:acyl-protein synthetase [Christensenellaceae bacterium OttesenSCG-928-M15]
MEAVDTLFAQKDVYDVPASDAVFLKSAKENIAFQIAHCEEYARLMKAFSFSPEQLLTPGDLARIPFLPTLFLKSNHLFSIPEQELYIKATSSGTRGQFSRVGFEKAAYTRGLKMVTRLFRRHGLLTVLPHHYMMLGYPPGSAAAMGAVQTAHGIAKLTPALSRTYALKETKDGFAPDIDEMLFALEHRAHSPFPIRFIGFPSFMYLLLKGMEKRSLALTLPPHSRILLAGGWKLFDGPAVDRPTLLALIEERLQIKRSHVHEFFSAVEHPIAYCACEHGHFHISIYSRVFARDIHTLAPLPHGQSGILNFITPITRAVPLISVATDDIGETGEGCTCNNPAPYFKLYGRAGLKDIKTCAAGASKWMENIL